MLEAMQVYDGIGLAAQQVGEPIKLCLVDMRVAQRREVFNYIYDGKRPPLELLMPLALINPEVEFLGKQETVRVEKETIQKQTDQLVEGVSILAQSSTAIQEQIRQIQPLSLNLIFDSFKNNRVMARFDADFSGGRNRHYQSKTIFLTDGIKTYAVFHTRETPFRLTGQPPNLQHVSGTLLVGNTRIEMSEAGFLAADPRILVVPVDTEVVKNEGIKVFPLALEPLRFPEAVLIDSEEGYYGVSGFKLDPKLEGYFSMQNKVFSRIFGEFSPSRGDLVFAQTGDFLGLMVNNQYCILVDSFYFASLIPLGVNFSAQEAEEAHAIARKWYQQRALELQ